MLLTQWIRVFLDDNGTFSDLSLALSERASSAAIPIVAAEDKLYVAQQMPFNNLFFQLGVANATASNVTVEYWDGELWASAVDIIDATASGGASLGRDGVLQYSPDRDEDKWQVVEDPREEPAAFGIPASIVINDQYWMRLSFSADLDVGTTLTRVGYKFCTDEQLQAIDPEIDLYLTSWEAGKTNWNEQVLLGSQFVISDMKQRGLIDHPGNLLRLDEISMAAAYRTLMTIYAKLGEGFDPVRDKAKENYNLIMNSKFFTLDRFKDGEVTPGEYQRISSGGGVR